jgi:hypothetical protein
VSLLKNTQKTKFKGKAFEIFRGIVKLKNISWKALK